MISLTYKMQAWPASLLNLIGVLAIVMVAFLVQVTSSFLIYADKDLSWSDNLKRIALVRQAVRAPHSITMMTQDEILMVLKQPSVKRHEMVVTAWHYHGETCA